MCMNLLAKKIIISVITVFMTASAMAQVSQTTIPTTTLGALLQSNTSFVDSVYNEWTDRFQKSFVAGGETWTKVKNFSSFDLNTPLNVTTIDVNYTEQIPYGLGVRSGTSSTMIWNNVNNSSVFPTNTVTMSSTVANTSVSFFSLYQGTTRTYQTDRDGWAFYNVSGTNTYLGFAEVGLHSGVDFNDGVFLFQSAVPEPETYAMWLGVLTLIVVGFRRYQNRRTVA